MEVHEKVGDPAETYRLKCKRLQVRSSPYKVHRFRIQGFTPDLNRWLVKFEGLPKLERLDYKMTKTDQIRLTTTVAGAGWASKLPPGDLAQALCGLEIPTNANVLVGMEKADDAGVYKISEELAIIQTVDFFTPIVDNPYWFGQIAAANALSDIYAMGGVPKTAMNLVGFPLKQMDISILRQVIQGGLDKLKEADVVLLGGHSIEDSEMKYGLSGLYSEFPTSKQPLKSSKYCHWDEFILYENSSEFVQEYLHHPRLRKSGL